MSDITFTDADGKTISLEQYLEGLEKKEKKIRDEIQAVEYNKEAKVPILRTKRAKNNKEMKDTVVTTKFLDREGKEMAEEGRYNEARRVVLVNIMRNQNEWKTWIDYASGVPYNLETKGDRDVCRTIVSNICEYFVSENMMVKKSNPEGRGLVYKFVANVGNINEELEPTYNRFLEFMKVSRQERRIKGATKAPREKSVPAKDKLVKLSAEKEQKEPVRASSPIIETITQKVNVDLNFNIHVFFSWGK